MNGASVTLSSWQVWAGALALAGVHLGAVHLTRLKRRPRSRWLSAAAGVSLGYVFSMFLPQLAERREFSGTWLEQLLTRYHVPIFVLTLLGLCGFFGLEKLALSQRGRSDSDRRKRFVFWLHIATFFGYNLVVGYLLVRGNIVIDKSFWFYLLAMGLHFMVNDVALQRLHRERYRRAGRWLLALAVFCGLGTAALVHPSKGTTALAVASLSGGILLNVLKEELPKEQEARFWPLVSAATLYSVLLVALT